MSSNSNLAGGSGDSSAHRILKHLFALSTLLFLAGGAVIVVLQVIMLVMAQGTAAREIAEAIGPYAFGTSSVAGILAFVLTYFKNGANLDGE